MVLIYLLLRYPYSKKLQIQEIVVTNVLCKFSNIVPIIYGFTSLIQARSPEFFIEGNNKNAGFSM